MKRIVIILVVVVLLASHAFSSTPADPNKISKDQTYNKMIVGKWAEEGEIYGIASFEENGKYVAWLYESQDKKRILHTIKGKWWIEDGKLYNTAGEITPPVPGFNSSEIVVDRIVEITEDSMTLIDDEFNQYTKTKIKE